MYKYSCLYNYIKKKNISIYKYIAIQEKEKTRLNSVYFPSVALFFRLCTFIRLHIKGVLNRLIFVLFFYFQNMLTDLCFFIVCFLIFPVVIFYFFVVIFYFLL